MPEDLYILDRILEQLPHKNDKSTAPVSDEVELSNLLARSGLARFSQLFDCSRVV
jgi:hypothetical protein